jgi:hypothetical protein
MVDGLRATLAKRAKTTIRPPPLSQPVGILINKPSEELDLRWNLNLPNRLV